MVELGVWYDQDGGDAHREGEPLILVRTGAELDALIDRARSETRDHRCPAAVQVVLHGNKGYPILEVGLGQSTGFIHYHADDDARTIGHGDPEGVAEYEIEAGSSRGSCAQRRVLRAALR
ncbi:Imm1 family immunity protein [Actinokineospora pegani]|uniref:Imm1 family immunity protein n=1 Tax=Actinokineospora pegani TaxID=2654637 RepID=UPI0012EAD04A|nr:Imm1 family immunity protein [Actinokineospora pegani]